MKRTPTYINQLVQAIAGPTVLASPEWGDMIPDWLRKQTTIDRMIELMKANQEDRDPIATDSEAVAYLMTASLSAPLNHDYAQIYFYLVKKVMQDSNQLESEQMDFLDVDELTDYEQRLLNNLKYDIYNKQKRGLKSIKEIRK